MKYSICGLTVEINPKFERTASRCEKYKINTDLSPDFILTDITKEEISAHKKIYGDMSDSFAEYVLYGIQFYEKILDFNAFLLHSSAVALDNKAYLFTANCGGGKSTHANLWVKNFQNAVIINDDKPVIRLIDGTFFACGTPFSGKYDINCNMLVPMQSICIVKQAKENKIYEVDIMQALSFIMTQTLRTEDKTRLDNLLSNITALLSKIKVYCLECDISKQAVTLAYNIMQKTNNNK